MCQRFWATFKKAMFFIFNTTVCDLCGRRFISEDLYSDGAVLMCEECFNKIKKENSFKLNKKREVLKNYLEK
jgi:hypothetical protein